ncbi:3-deoxy-manno-octulosonate cytidylyltransferase [Pseudoalteromonas haloplanktis]|uniref:3-deoxy-manno-octulosonate cytidylyltransferase n=1 Tax=Pseudoalteromonas haloplanktis TaxID=228 RepID=A0A9W4R0D8_PSEHA|nr:3-deoxy-manno-octulosonate cytidylyltransferase [Pseudoalteromonas haloplanktis]CAH9061670.1 3-deoxy-manno-octulosonate cytidylyltransferase [Pseudoalteromonas haloplanktis]
MSKEVKVVIPARYGSSRLPGKPLLLLNGKPMYWHVVQRVIEAGVALSDIVVATDDERIVQSVISESIPVQITSSKHVSGTDRINEVVTTNKWDDNVVVLNVQGDEPLIPSALIADLISFSINNKDYSITTAVTPIQSESDYTNPNVVKAILAEENRALYFTRSASPFSRDNPKDYSLAYRHIGIYGYRVSALKRFCTYPESKLEEYEKLEQLRALSYGMSIGAIVATSAPPHGIDTKADYEELKQLMANK